MTARNVRARSTPPDPDLVDGADKRGKGNGKGGKGKGQGGKGKENIDLEPEFGTSVAAEAAQAPARLPIPRSEVALPLEPSTLVECRYRDGKMYPARIVHRQCIASDPEEWQYYVHYRKFNRRMDEWVSLDNLNLDTVIPPEPLDPSDQKGKKKRMQEEHSDEEGHEGLDRQALIQHEEHTKVKNVGSIELGRHSMETWYYSPLPPEYHPVQKLYFCEYDLTFFKRREEMLRHLKKVRLLHPPGMEIYRHNGISMFEVDGSKAKMFCQNLCYLAKLFLDHKVLDSDVDIFLFYVMCECDERGAHMVGYFSKNKVSDRAFNLACILTFPAYQRRGYGKFLIQFSYELSKIENKVGSPETPISDLGMRAYRGYWTRVLLDILKERQGAISIKQLSDMTMFKTDDIISTLTHLKLIQYQKGQHAICAAPHVIDGLLKKCGSPGLVVDPTKIVWSPYDASREFGK